MFPPFFVAFVESNSQLRQKQLVAYFEYGNEGRFFWDRWSILFHISTKSMENNNIVALACSNVLIPNFVIKKFDQMQQRISHTLLFRNCKSSNSVINLGIFPYIVHRGKKENEANRRRYPTTEVPDSRT